MVLKTRHRSQTSHRNRERVLSARETGRQGFIRLCVAIAGALVVTPTSAVTSDSQDSESLIRDGVEMRRLGKEEEALKLLQAAFAAHPSARARAQIGLAEEALGQWIQADTDLDSALQAVEDPWIVKSASRLRAALVAKDAHLGTLQVLGSPTGAKVTADGRDLGPLPMNSAKRVACGEVVLSVAAEGYFTITRRIAGTAGTTGAAGTTGWAGTRLPGDGRRTTRPTLVRRGAGLRSSAQTGPAVKRHFRFSAVTDEILVQQKRSERMYRNFELTPYA